MPDPTTPWEEKPPPVCPGCGADLYWQPGPTLVCLLCPYRTGPDQ